MRIFRSVLPIWMVTIVALGYVHQQVELVKLSYAIERKENRLKDMLDRREVLEYNIFNLEAPSRLEQALASQKIDITFPKRANVVKVAKSISVARPDGLRSSGLEKRAGLLGILEFFIPRAEAQVKER